jgi:hypothetical protein
MNRKDPDSDARAQEFFLAEYKCLRDEINNRLVEIATLERYFLVGSAAIYAWLAAVQFGLAATSGATTMCQYQHTALLVLKAMWFVPFALACLGGLRAWDSGRRIAQIGSYIRTVENKWRSGDLDQALGKSESDSQPYWGWEGFIAPPCQRRFKYMGLSPASLVFWIASCVLTLALGVMVLIWA